MIIPNTLDDLCFIKLTFLNFYLSMFINCQRNSLNEVESIIHMVFMNKLYKQNLFIYFVMVFNLKF